MKISGFTIIKNAVINDYPVVEAITSILPVVDEMIVAIGDSTDATEALIRSIPSDKIRIVYSTWEPAINKGGAILAVETDKAFKHIAPDSDWAFYIQADEVVHEKYHSIIRETAEKYVNDKKVQGLLFNYLHFYGTYDYVGDSRTWYHKEIRIIRNNPEIKAFRDAQGFRIDGKRLPVKQVEAYVYHYGWVKSPKQMQLKRKNSLEFWDDRSDIKKETDAAELFDYSEFDSLVKFEGTHPSVMLARVKEQNWQVALDISKKKFSFSDRILYWIEKKTGWRLFDFKNYKII